MKPVKNFKQTIDRITSRNRCSFYVNHCEFFIHYIDQTPGNTEGSVLDIDRIDRVGIDNSFDFGMGDEKITPNVVFIEINWKTQMMKWYFRSKTSVRTRYSHMVTFEPKNFETFDSFSSFVFNTFMEKDFWKGYTTPIV
jgi:hypothetical protein